MLSKAENDQKLLKSALYANKWNSLLSWKHFSFCWSIKTWSLLNDNSKQNYSITVSLEKNKKWKKVKEAGLETQKELGNYRSKFYIREKIWIFSILKVIYSTVWQVLANQNKKWFWYIITKFWPNCANFCPLSEFSLHKVCHYIKELPGSSCDLPTYSKEGGLNNPDGFGVIWS